MMQIAADIIAVADLPFTRVRGDHRHAAVVDQLSSKQARFGGRRSASAVDVGSKDRLHLIAQDGRGRPWPGVRRLRDNTSARRRDTRLALGGCDLGSWVRGGLG